VISQGITFLFAGSQLVKPDRGSITFYEKRFLRWSPLKYTPTKVKWDKKIMNQTDNGREIRRAERVADISEDDIKIALDMEKDGTPIPESLKNAVEDYKSKNNLSEKKDDEDDAGSRPSDEKPDNKDKSDDTPVAGEDNDKPEDKDNKPDDKDNDDDDEDLVDPDKSSQRQVRAMPIDKFKAKRDAWKEREKELLGELEVSKSKIAEFEKAKSNDNEKKMEQILKDAAEKSGLDEDTLKTIFSSMEEGIVKPLHTKIVELEEAVKKASEKPADEKQRLQDKEQDDKFDNEFALTLKQADADPEMSKYKEEIKELAFTKDNVSKSVWEIWNRVLKPKLSTKKAPPESPSGQGGGTGAKVDWEEISKDPEKIRNLSIEDAQKFQEYMGSKPRPIRRVR